MSGYDRRSSRDGGRVSGFSDGYGARESDRGAGRDEPRASRYDDRGRNDDGYGYGRGGDDHGRSPYPPPPDARGPPAPSSGGRRDRPDSGFGDRDRADYGFDRRGGQGSDGYGAEPKRARRDSPSRGGYDRSPGGYDRGYDRERGYNEPDRRAPPRSPPRDSRGGHPPQSRGGDGYGGGFDDRAPPSSYDRGRGRDAGYPPPPRRDASRDRAPNSGGNTAGGDDRDEHQMEVPAEVAKIVIGAGGNSIKDLQDRTGAHVMIYKPQPGARESGYRPVMIRGSRRAVDLATDELRRVVRDYEDGVVGGKAGRDRGHDRGGFGDRYGGGYERDAAQRGGGGGGRYDRYDDRGPKKPYDARGGYDDRRGSFPPFGANDGADHVQERIECPVENRGIVIGKNGKQVQRIERDTGAKVSSQGDEPFLIIRGTPTSVRNARSQIASILDAADMPPLPPPPPEGAQHALEVHVEREHIGKVMGYGGMTIKRAQADTQCVMKWDKENQRIQLWGSPDIVEAGRRRIEDLVEQAKVEIAKENADATTVEVPTRGHTGFIIGGGGQNVKRMERETGARLRMDDRAQIMVITGRSAAVEKAARMVEDAVERAEAIERGEPPERREGGDDRYRDDFRR